MLFEAGCLLLFSGLLDLLDGAVARVSGAASNPFGGILDSSLDRYGDAFVFIGLIFYLFERAAVGYAALAMSALAGSFLISYVRARSESAGRPCRVGYWERGERLVYLSLGLVLANLAAVLWVLGTLTHLTVLYRLNCARDPDRAARLSSPAASLPRRFFLDTRRSSGFYAVKTAFFLLLLWVFRPPL
jgi:CDP-diacylglycerol--glycerol-3-phosphate 3-phosphatidyltransferase